VPGRELTCAVMGNVALGVIDIVPKIGFYDYKAKYEAGGSEHILPADIPQHLSTAGCSGWRLQRTWRLAARACRARTSAITIPKAAKGSSFSLRSTPSRA
jgi:hypothetical protein